jgi:pimeloyl-ACP methyl ester carboxylesterase
VTDLLVLHDVGAPGGGAWTAAFADWPGRVSAPDLPGHHGAPPPVGGNYETHDALYVALDTLRADPPDELVVIGVGHQGAAAQILALGGRAAGLVLVDGLGGPWLTPEEIEERERELRRRILATPDALTTPAIGTDDPRATMVLGPADRDFAVRQADAMPVPVLVVETPSSPTPDADQLAGHFARSTLLRLDGRDLARIAAAVVAWWTANGRR